MIYKERIITRRHGTGSDSSGESVDLDFDPDQDLKMTSLLELGIVHWGYLVLLRWWRCVTWALIEHGEKQQESWSLCGKRERGNIGLCWDWLETSPTFSFRRESSYQLVHYCPLSSWATLWPQYLYLRSNNKHRLFPTIFRVIPLESDSGSIMWSRHGLQFLIIILDLITFIYQSIRLNHSIISSLYHLFRQCLEGSCCTATRILTSSSEMVQNQPDLNMDAEFLVGLIQQAESSCFKLPRNYPGINQFERVGSRSKRILDAPILVSKPSRKLLL